MIIDPIHLHNSYLQKISYPLLFVLDNRDIEIESNHF
jgi:hypothetical protein